MRKTGQQIEDDVFDLVQNSELSSFVKGKIYKEGTRPADSDNEDAIVSFKTGLDAQFQVGELTLNIYVPDIDNGSKTLVKDIARCREIEEKSDKIVRTFSSGEYLFTLGAIPQTYQLQSEDINKKQHFVNIKLRFSRNSVFN